MVQRSRAHMKIWCMHIACWIPQATNTYSEYITVIAFPTAKMVAWTHINVTLYINIYIYIYIHNSYFAHSKENRGRYYNKCS